MKKKQMLKEMYWKFKSLGKEKKFCCPICSYEGAFKKVSPSTGVRKYALCPKCGSAERHRLQKLVLDQVFQDYDLSQAKILHFAPENFFRQHFQSLFSEYVSADLYMLEVDVKCDITDLPFVDKEFDCVYASHVLEHIQDDTKALSEIRRILKPSGIAILPVPIVEEVTIEYPEPNPAESNHVRAPGKDYYQRYQQFFSKVKCFTSEDFPEKYQTFVYEDRTDYPSEAFPLRHPMIGQRHIDIVPVCFV